jgi:hypothetical protein
MKTAVDLVFVGKDRTFNRRFLLLTDHYRFTPTACTPAAVRIPEHFDQLVRDGRRPPVPTWTSSTAMA